MEKQNPKLNEQTLKIKEGFILKNLNPEIINKARAARSVEELLELAKANGVEMSTDEAATYFAQLNPKRSELNDDELDNVSGGGCDKAPEEKAVGNIAGEESDDDSDYEDKNRWLIFSKI